jgi:hypothetical protein
MEILNEKALNEMRGAMSAARIESGNSGFTVLNWLARSGELIPGWWSQSRDAYLRKFWIGSDILSGAMYSVVSRVSSIPCRIEARDMNVQSHQELAALYSDLLFRKSQLLQGWSALMEHAMQDYLGQDNGMFIEVLGGGDPSGPLVGNPISLYHRDASRCVRTADPEYPVVYLDKNGKRYKMHYTRIIYTSQLSSPMIDMNGVGVCAVSRCINAAQNLIDIARYKQEKLGSRPPRQIIVGKGITATQIAKAFAVANAQMDSQNLSTFSKTVVLGTQDSNVGLELIDLASVPDGFDENTGTNLGVYIVALAFGTDARDFWPATSSGATKADALVQHMKARGKGTAQILQVLTEQLNNKFLPPELRVVFDLQDDEEDDLQAEVRGKRAITRKEDLSSNIVSMRTAREHALRDNDLTQEQFEELELQDGRLPDGMPVLTLFYSKDPLVKELLQLSIPEPMSIVLEKPIKRKKPDFYVTPAPPRETQFKPQGKALSDNKPEDDTELDSKPENDSEPEEFKPDPKLEKLFREVQEAIINAQRKVVWASTARIKHIALQCVGCLQAYENVIEDMMGVNDPVEPPSEEASRGEGKPERKPADTEAQNAS